MGWFNVLKGAYPSLQQIDKTLPVAAGQAGITRGSLIYQDGQTFKLMTASQDTGHLYYAHFCLVAQDDLTAGMAGTVGQGVPGGSAVVTGLTVGMPFEFETSEFNKTPNYTVGMLLTAGASGKLTSWSTTKNVIAQVTKTIRTRWVNDAIAVTGFRTGANMNILTARTLWLPEHT